MGSMRGRRDPKRRGFHSPLTMAFGPILSTTDHHPATREPADGTMTAEETTRPQAVRPNAIREDVEIAWRFLKLNWILLGLMSAALALSVGAHRFLHRSRGPAGVARLRRDLRRICPCQCALGEAPRPAGHVRARRHRPDRAGHGGDVAAHLCGGGGEVSAAGRQPASRSIARSASTGRAMSAFVNDHPLLATWLSYGYTMIRWPIFAIPVVLAAAHRYRRIEEFTLAFALALIATTIVSALVPAIGVYQQIGLDPAQLPNLDPRAYLDQVRDLAAGARRHVAPSRSVRACRHRDLPELPRRLGGALCLGVLAGAGGCARSRSSPTARCWPRPRSTAGTISSISPPASHCRGAGDRWRHVRRAADWPRTARIGRQTARSPAE